MVEMLASVPAPLGRNLAGRWDTVCSTTSPSSFSSLSEGSGYILLGYDQF